MIHLLDARNAAKEGDRNGCRAPGTVQVSVKISEVDCLQYLKWARGKLEQAEEERKAPYLNRPESEDSRPASAISAISRPASPTP
jgi:hypothetical protein